MKNSQRPCDRVSDKLVAILQSELDAGTDPLEILCGVLLAYKSVELTMPRHAMPDTLQSLADHSLIVLRELNAYLIQKRHVQN